jgi:ParB family chromosome partitioning protein
MFESTGMSVANPRLGRGLAALMGDAPPAAAAAAAGPAQVLPIERLEPGPFQPRTSFHSDTLAELVDSIRARGILQPLLVRPHPARPEQFQIIAGERRWRAAQQAGLHEVPVLLRALTDQEAMAASLVENLQRQDLNPIEEGEGFRRLIEEFGLTQEQLGAAVGKSRSHVANAMRLLQLPPAVRVEVQKGTLSAGHARALLGHPDPEQAAKQVIARGLNVRQTEALATARQTGSSAREPAEKDPETVALERDLSERLGLTVQISFDGKGGSVTLKYRNLDQLDSLMALLNRS